MRNLLSVLTLVIVLVGLAAFVGCSKAVNDETVAESLTLNVGDTITGDIVRSERQVESAEGDGRVSFTTSQKTCYKRCMKLCSPTNKNDVTCIDKCVQNCIRS